MKIHDCLIIGGGFAGLSAGIYLARFMRSALIIDNGDGRWNTHETNQNYLGFPDSILVRELRARGLKQALKFGAILQNDKITQVKKNDGLFTAKGQKGEYLGKTIIIATGVKDILPEFPNWQDYWGRSFFWCIMCDGYKTRGKKVLIVGNSDDAAITAMQFLNFTKQVIFVTNQNPGKIRLSEKWKDNLTKAKITIYEGKIKEVVGKLGMMTTVILDNGKEISTDFLFNQQGAEPQIELAKQLGVKINDEGYIITDYEQRTNIPFVYAAGDVTKNFAHQVVTAVHEGSSAAEAANYDLYRPEQRYP